MIVLISILFAVFFTYSSLRNRGKFNAFLIMSIASWYYLIAIPYLGILGYDIVGFNLSADYWLNLMWLGTVYNVSMCAAIYTPIFKCTHRDVKKKINNSMVGFLFLFVCLVYLGKYLLSGSFIFSDYPFFNVLSVVLVVSSLLLISNAGKYKAMIFYAPSLFILLYLGFRVKILLLFSNLIVTILNHRLLAFAFLPLFIFLSYVFENSRNYGLNFHFLEFINRVADFDYTRIADYLTNQGEASVSLYSAIIIHSGIGYENFWDPYVYTLKKFLFIEAEDPFNVIIDFYGNDFPNYGFAFFHFVELYLIGGIFALTLIGYLYGLFIKLIESILVNLFHPKNSNYLIAYFSLFFGFYNYSRGHFYQISTDFIVSIVVIFLAILNIRRRKDYV